MNKIIVLIALFAFSYCTDTRTIEKKQTEISIRKDLIPDLIRKNEPDSIVMYLNIMLNQHSTDTKSILAGLNFLHEKQKFKEALDLIDILIIENPTIEALAIKASIYVDSGRNQDAIDIYDKLIHLNDTLVNLRIGRFIALSELNRYREAIDDLNLILQKKQTDTYFLNCRAELKYYVGDLKGSYLDYKKSSELGDTIALENIKGYHKNKPESKKW